MTNVSGMCGELFHSVSTESAHYRAYQVCRFIAMQETVQSHLRGANSDQRRDAKVRRFVIDVVCDGVEVLPMK